MPSRHIVLAVAACVAALSAPIPEAQAKRRPANKEARPRVQPAPPSPGSDRSGTTESRGRLGGYDDPRFERGM